ncbi:MAG: 50S ribosomal protein L34e [archaeon]|nr:50S ribosomal protein L34e [Nanoarchaeota archaeon]
MPRGMHKSRTLRRVFVKTPSGKNVLHYRKRKPSRAHCGACGAILTTVPRELPAKMANIPKSKKRPERPYGGLLCTKCLRMMMKERARSEE